MKIGLASLFGVLFVALAAEWYCAARDAWRFKSLSNNLLMQINQLKMQMPSRDKDGRFTKRERDG